LRQRACSQHHTYAQPLAFAIFHCDGLSKRDSLTFAHLDEHADRDSVPHVDAFTGYDAEPFTYGYCTPDSDDFSYGHRVAHAPPTDSNVAYGLLGADGQR
jgi:hypothetical protein